MLLSIDPSTTTIGCALFDGSVLYAATSIKLDVIPDQDPVQRWYFAALAIEKWLYGFNRGWANGFITEVVFERPQLYSATKSKGDPNKLVGVLGVGAMVAGRMTARSMTRVFTYLPAEWTGQISKVCPTCKGKAKKKCESCEGSAWKTPRGRRIRGRLTPAELALVPDQNDAIDAVGIGLKHVGRLEIHRVYESE